MTRLLVLVALISMGSALDVVAGDPKKLMEQEILEVQPSSFDELWDDAAAVVHARVIAASPSVRTAGTVFTPVRLQILEGFKGNIEWTRQEWQLTVYQMAGEVESNGIVVRVRDREVLRAGREYVLLLGWNPYSERWMVRGNDGVFELRGESLRPWGRSAVARARDDERPQHFLTELRSRGGSSVRRRH
ncbi:MAG TPA: hypothetical protein VF701_21880 [Thermoanaerobaculia bacterium]